MNRECHNCPIFYYVLYSRLFGGRAAGPRAALTVANFPAFPEISALIIKDSHSVKHTFYD